jgi:hypothetical protein
MPSKARSLKPGLGINRTKAEKTKAFEGFSRSTQIGYSPAPGIKK